jgi:hypothetical protein
LYDVFLAKVRALDAKTHTYRSAIAEQGRDPMMVDHILEQLQQLRDDVTVSVVSALTV